MSNIDQCLLLLTKSLILWDVDTNMYSPDWCYSTIVCIPVISFMKFIPFVTYSDKYWHSNDETNPGQTKMMTARQQLSHKTTGLIKKKKKKIDSPHLCRLIGDGLGLCVYYRDVLGGDFTPKGVGDIRNSDRFCLHHRRLWKGSRHSRKWVENCFSHYINFTSTHHQLLSTIWNLWSSLQTVRLVFCADYLKKPKKLLDKKKCLVWWKNNSTRTGRKYSHT